MHSALAAIKRLMVKTKLKRNLATETWETVVIFHNPIVEHAVQQVVKQENRVKFVNRCYYEYKSFLEEPINY